MKNKSKLSVIIPVKNGEEHISRCLESVLNQSLKDIDIIVIDDGSTDNTSIILKEYATLNHNITVIKHANNLGTGAARNTGLNIATTEYVSFLDADDWIDTNAYQRMIHTIGDTKADIAVCGIRTEFSSIERSSIRYSYPYINTISSQFALKLLCKCESQDVYISPMVGNKMFSRELLSLHSIKFPQMRYFEDDEFTFWAISNARKIALVPDVYQHYYQRDGSAMHTFSKETIDCLICAFQNLQSYLINKGDYENKKTELFSFLSRCITSLLDTLFSCEQSVSKQRQYLTYFLNLLLESFTIDELLLHIDPYNLYRLWK